MDCCSRRRSCNPQIRSKVQLEHSKVRELVYSMERKSVPGSMTRCNATVDEAVLGEMGCKVPGNIPEREHSTKLAAGNKLVQERNTLGLACNRPV